MVQTNSVLQSYGEIMEDAFNRNANRLPFQKPAELADGLGLESDLNCCYRQFLAPSLKIQGNWVPRFRFSNKPD